MANGFRTYTILANQIEALLCRYGVAYHRGAGDFTVVHDYYGHNEVGVVIMAPFFNDIVLEELQAILRREAPTWEIWVTFEDPLMWRDMSQIVVTARGWRNSPSGDD